MRITITHRLLALIFAVTVVAVPAVLGRPGAFGSGPQAQAGDNAQSVPDGKRMKIKGVITQRTPDGYMLEDAKFVKTSVVLTDSTRVELDGKPVTAAQRAELAELVGGIIVQTEGH